MFEIGKEYKRKEEIHGLYGGQAQGGISTPKNHPLVFVFSSGSGEKHGYKDEYREDGVFWYTGEGQLGDMRMVSGNRAILEHSKNKKTIHVFEYTRKAYVRYVGVAYYLGYHKETRPDRKGNNRTVIVFHLDIDSLGELSSVQEHTLIADSKNTKSLQGKTIEELRDIALSSPPINLNPTEKRSIAYYRSRAIKLYVLERSKGYCEGCGDRAPFESKQGPFLECHHLHRLSDGGPDHPKNVIALCPNCHRRAHYAKDHELYNRQLTLSVLKLESVNS